MAEPSSEHLPDLPGVADLYQHEPSSFVPARNALVKELRAAGDRDGARVVAALRRPTPAAWGANLLARNRPDLIEAVLDAAARWQDASSTGDRSGTQASQDDLRAATAAATDCATDLMAAADRAARPDEVDALRSTLQAAAVDDDLAQILRAGLLEAPSAGSGFDGIAAGFGVSAGPAPRAGAESRPAGRRGATKKRPVADDEGEARESEQKADQQAEQAEQEARAAEQRRLEAEAEQLAEQARTAREAADRAEEVAAEARRTADAARLVADDAEAAAAAARARIPPA